MYKSLWICSVLRIHKLLSYMAFINKNSSTIELKINQFIFYFSSSVSSGASPRRISINFPTSAQARLDSGIKSIAI